MAQWGNPEVREWMKGHKEEVAKVQQRYDELKELDLAELVDLSVLEDADAIKIKDALIARIIAAEGTK